MKIKLKKEGGFMGLSSNADLEVEKLSDEEREIMNDIMTTPPNKKVEKEAKEKEDGDDRGMTMRDAFSYEIKMKKGPRYVTVKFDDKSIPEKVYKIFQKYISDIPTI